MRGLLALLLLALTAVLLLFFNQDKDPPMMVAELVRGGLHDRPNGAKCDVANLEELRKSAIVYTWVNGTERCYNERRKRAGLPPGGSSRDKEMGELKYSIRSLLKFAPWLEGPIYIVTPGQIPDWLDVSNPRIKVVDQDELLPRDKVKLPTFDTNVIEQYLHKIPDLTDVFIHMNDDYLFVKPITPDRLFTCDGGLRFLSEINHIRHVPGKGSNAWLASVRNTVELTDKTYGGEHVYNFLKHAPFVYSRRAFEAIHEKFGEQLDATASHQLRHHEDLNMPLLHHIYMVEEGSAKLGIPVAFNPLLECDDWLLIRVNDNDPEGLQKHFDLALQNRGPEVLLALNDEYSDPSTARQVSKFYEALLPEPGYYELPAGQHVEIVSNYHGSECAYDPTIIQLPSTDASSTMLRQRLTYSSNFRRPKSLFEEYFMNVPPSSASFLTSMGLFFGLAIGVVCSGYVFRLANRDILAGSNSKNR